MYTLLKPIPLACLLLSGCVSYPNAPSIMALPGSGMSFDQFRRDDDLCRQYANWQVGGANAPAQAAADNAVSSAIVGTVIGAALGAAVGGGEGAAIGAGAGLLSGALMASDASYAGVDGSQQQLDTSYIQCMYAKGHQVPVYGNFTAPAVPAPQMIPPPPPPGWRR